MVKAYLYDAEGRDRAVNAGKATLAATGDRQLLWFDLERRDTAALDATARLLGLPAEARATITAPAVKSVLVNYDDHFQLSVPAPPEGGRESRNRLDLLVGPNWLVTVRDTDIGFLSDFREQDRGETMKGALTPAVLAASLLDWHLESYLDAVAEVETALDKVDDQVLAARTNAGALGRLARMRRRVAVLRAAVAEQRPIFHGLVRPDFLPVADDAREASFRALAGRFDRVVDAIDRARDGVVGSFDLFASKTGQETNELVKALTFVTVVIGFAAAVAGLFGMNFDVPIFHSGTAGFLSVIGALITVVAIAGWLARRRGWV